MTKNFVDIVGYEGYYQININGDVRSIDRMTSDGMGKFRFRESRIMPSSDNGKGYLTVSLCKNGIVRRLKLHSLLAKQFIPNPMGYKIVRHLNDVKKDNRIENLAWGTHQDNMQDAYKNGSFKNNIKGERHHWFGRKKVPFNKGIKGSESHSAKLVLNTETGIFYMSAEESAHSVGRSIGHVRGILNGARKNKTALIYV